MNALQEIVARQRTFQMMADGEGLRLCMALGDREGAQRYRREMEAQRAALGALIEQIELEGGCYFAAAGDVSRFQGEAGRAVSG